MSKRQDPNKCSVCGARRGHLTRFSLVNHDASPPRRRARKTRRP